MATSGETVKASRVPRLLDRDTLTATTANVTTVETVVMSVSADLIAGETYKIMTWGRYDVSTNGDDPFIRIKEDSVSGTQLQGDIWDIPDQLIAWSKTLTAFYVAVSDGPKTFVHTIVRNAGGGNLTIAAASTVPAHMELWLTGL
jgi:CO dehydrogenase/acetyl-CoA synthase delta subunit